MIFISYRRDDTQGWAGRLFADLSRRFGATHVFMDINGGIRRGDDFAQTLHDALQRSEVLLALIGPRWLELRRQDGRRRIDVEDDWVRREIATALERGIVVVPVRLGRAALPTDEQLPEELRLLRARQDSEISDERWDFDVEALATDISHHVAPGDLGRARSGLAGLRAALAQQPALAQSLRQSRQVVEDTYRQIARLEGYKILHDALHRIEFECLMPMQQGAPGSTLRPFRRAFEGIAAVIRRTLAEHDVPPTLAQELVDRLDDATLALAQAVEEPGAPTRTAALSALALLLSGLPPRLDDGISAAAADVSLDRLLELLATVPELAGADNTDAELAPLVEGVVALQRLRDDLHRRVQEHRQLQNLDARLRAACAAETPPPTLALEWAQVKRVRARIALPGPAPLRLAEADLNDIEGEIDAALADGQAGPAYDLLREYFRIVATTFRDVDSDLKAFCLQLSEVGQPLRVVLQML